MKNHKIHFNKEQISDRVIRRALYWMSDSCGWLLNDDQESWIVTLDEKAEPKDVQTLHRLINDQILREKIDIETGGLRRSIVRKVLTSIERTV